MWHTPVDIPVQARPVSQPAASGIGARHAGAQSSRASRMNRTDKGQSLPLPTKTMIFEGSYYEALYRNSRKPTRMTVS